MARPRTKSSTTHAAPPRPGYRSRYAHLSPQELNLELRRHMSRLSMAFFDRLSPEERETVREGNAPLLGYTWQIQGRDALGRFTGIAIRS